MHVNDFRSLVKDGETASQHRLLRTAQAAGHLDSSQLMIACEAPGCTNSVPVDHVYSLAAVYRMPGPNVPGFQCPEEQHFGCSHEHAKLAMMECLTNHIEPLHQALRDSIG